MAGSELMGLPRPGAPEFAGTAGSGLTVAELVELTALRETVGPARLAVHRAAAPADHPAGPVGSARLRRGGDLPGTHPDRPAAPAGLARPEARLAAARARLSRRRG